jgi:Flp pilus assembly protein TadD
VLPDAQRALELNPKLAGAWGLRGLARLAAGQAAEAQTDFAECLKLAPQMKDMLDREIAMISSRR